MSVLTQIDHYDTPIFRGWLMACHVTDTSIVEVWINGYGESCHITTDWSTINA